MSGAIEDRASASRPFRIGDWLVEPSLNRLSRNDTTIHLEIKAMDVLLCLAERAGEVVPRQEIVDRVWATEFISDNTLTHNVSELRNALGDDSRNPTFIETIHRRGYRLIAPVAVQNEAGGTVARFPAMQAAASADMGRSPYPGLTAFTEEDAKFFYGREAEVAQMWRKLTSWRLLAVIGPSGVGKSSFLRAGMIPARPDGWGVVVCQPGGAPFGALARALVGELGSGHGVTSKASDFRDPGEIAVLVGRWRDRHEHGLLIVDQFEELLTLDATDEQRRFTDFLGRCVAELDLHVLLAMRDDFLHRCHAYPPLWPIFEHLTALEQPDAEVLYRTLVEPARCVGFAFEDDDLPREMVAEVERERGALPLLAFAVERLWERRDRERLLLTRQAYADIGKVGGALARHAEATLTAIGDERLPVVRELFRNLVTAEGTRAVRDYDELLSIFSDSQSESQEVMRHLIAARLLTSFEAEAVTGDASSRRIEVVHESLLSAWPRLIRWRAQNADEERFRDQFRQAAQTWHGHERSNDFLWTGSAYREFVVWRKGYPGLLSKLEEEYAGAMARDAKKRTRARGFLVGAALMVAAALAVVFGVLWLQSARETRRAEAAKLALIGESEEVRSARLAYSTASLELHDNAAARNLAVRTLWEGPPAFYFSAPENESWYGSMVNRDDPAIAARVVAPWAIAFSPDGRHLAIGYADGTVHVLDDQGDIVTPLVGHRAFVFSVIWSPDGKRLASSGWDERVMLWSFPSGEPLREILPGGLSAIFFSSDGKRLLTEVGRRHEHTTVWKSWPVDGGGPTVLRTFENVVAIPWLIEGNSDFSPHNGTAVVHPKGQELELASLDRPELPPVFVGRHDGQIQVVTASPDGKKIASCDEHDHVQIWHQGGHQGSLGLQGCEGVLTLRLNSPGSLLAAACDSGSAFVWDLRGPPEANPTVLHHSGQAHQVAFDPNGRWIATTSWAEAGIAFWPYTWRCCRALSGHTSRVTGLEFHPEGKWLVSGSYDGTLRVWPLSPEVDPQRSRVALTLPKGRESKISCTAISPDGTLIVVGSQSGELRLLTGDGALLNTLDSPFAFVDGVAVHSSNRLVAVRGAFDPEHNFVKLWDVAADTTRVLDAGDGVAIKDFQFVGADLLTSGSFGLRMWDVATGDYRTIRNAPSDSFDVDANGARAVLVTPEGVIIHDLQTGDEEKIAARGSQVRFDPTGEIVVVLGGEEGAQVIWLNGGGTHLLPGPRREVPMTTAFSPDGAWIAVGSDSGAVRLWPMPDLSKPALHTLPHDELIAKLRTLTNLRAVRDEASSTGWKLKVGPFAGWATVPEW